MSSLPCLHGGASNDAVLVCDGGDYDDDGSSGDEVKVAPLTRFEW